MKSMSARHWLVGIILLVDVFLVIAAILAENLGILFFIPFWSFPIGGLLKQERWANIYLVFVIIGLIFLDLMAIGFSGDSGSFLGVMILVAFTILMIVLNIKSSPPVAPVTSIEGKLPALHKSISWPWLVPIFIIGLILLYMLTIING